MFYFIQKTLVIKTTTDSRLQPSQGCSVDLSRRSSDVQRGQTNRGELLRQDTVTFKSNENLITVDSYFFAPDGVELPCEDVTHTPAHATPPDPVTLPKQWQEHSPSAVLTLPGTFSAAQIRKIKAFSCIMNKKGYSLLKSFEITAHHSRVHAFLTGF